MGRSVKTNSRLRQMQNTDSSYGSRTDVGCIRDHNEDSLIVTPSLFAVADGMGGHAAGEVASEIAVSTLEAYAPLTADSEELVAAVKKANEAVIQAALDGTGRPGMGTTMTAAILEGSRLVIAHVGDSRAYVLHDGRLLQITRDHSLVADLIEAGQLTPEEAWVHPQRSIITRALGSDPNMQVDVYELNLATGDRLLLCSDGLSSMILDDQIEKIMCSSSDPQKTATSLVNAALEAGGMDNVTVIVIDAIEPIVRKRKATARKTKVLIAVIITLLVLLMAGTAFAFSAYLNTVAYLKDAGGYVAIYKGVPSSIGGFNLSEEVEVTNIKTNDLQPGVKGRVQEGLRVDSIAKAKELVDGYREQLVSEGKMSASSSSNLADILAYPSSSESASGTSSESTSSTSGSSISSAGQPAASKAVSVHLASSLTLMKGLF